MATYVIGDIQGCFVEFECLLDKLDFDTQNDQLWLVGDLVNRGPDSLKVLRLVKSLGENVIVVLGNHDLHMLAIFYANHSPRRSDTLDSVFAAPDAPEIMRWLVSKPLFYRDRQLDACMVHAGIPHIWSIDEAEGYAREVETYIQLHAENYFLQMYGNVPNPWSNTLQGMDRVRCITNYLARMRFIDDKGLLNFESKGAPGCQPDGFYAWCDLREVNSTQIYFGHWASLAGEVETRGLYAVDTGCVWGASLTAQCIETGQRTSVPAAG